MYCRIGLRFKCIG